MKQNSREDKYKVTIPDTDFYRKMVKCQAACPVLTDARGYIQALVNGDIELGYQIAQDPNPLATICGRICGAPCETACRRGSIGPELEPVAIRPLKRVTTERYGPEADWELPGDSSTAQFLSAGRKLGFGPGKPGEQFSTVSWSRQNLVALSKTPGRRTGKVAVIGAGPAGLTAAHNLALLGHKVTIFEASSKAGGMVRLGVPIYRMDWDALDREIESILELGVEICFNTRIGENIPMSALRNEFDAVFLGIGLMEGRNLNLPGSELDGIVPAVDLLLNYNMGYRVDLGKRVVVVGGGDVAMDAARTALRLGAAKNKKELHWERESEELQAALDVARTALRLGVADVRIMALESWEELPASRFELEEAREEGIQIYPRLGPVRFTGENGTVTGIEVIDVQSVFDQDGKFNPQFIPGTEKVWECDSVILAVGQKANLTVLKGANDVIVSPRGLVQINPETGQTSAHDVFAGGDLAYGPRMIIHAIRDGHIASLGIEAFLQGRSVEKTTFTSWETLKKHKMPVGWLDYVREKVPSLSVERRTGISQVETGYSLSQAQTQAMRCLECSINTVFDGSLCILCNGCVDVCPWDCLKIVRIDSLAGDKKLPTIVEAALGQPVEYWAEENHPSAAAMIKDDDICTRCGLCAQRCPTNALTMETFRFQEGLVYVETENR